MTSNQKAVESALQQATDEYVWEDCLDDFVEQANRLRKFEMRTISTVNRDEYTSCIEMMDPQTDPNVGWELCETMQGLLIEGGRVPMPEELSVTDFIDLYDHLQTLEYILLDGMNPRCGTFSCVYMWMTREMREKIKCYAGMLSALSADEAEKKPGESKVEIQLCMNKLQVALALISSFLAFHITQLRISTVMRVLDNEENYSHTLETVAICQNVDLTKTLESFEELLGLKNGKGAPFVLDNPHLKERMELRLKMLRILELLATRDSCKPQILHAAIESGAEIAETIRNSIIPYRICVSDALKTGSANVFASNPSLIESLFPRDVKYWLTAQVLPAPEISFLHHISCIADMYECISKFRMFDAGRDIFELIDCAEQIAQMRIKSSHPILQRRSGEEGYELCQVWERREVVASTRALAALYVFGENATVSILGTASMELRILKFLTEQLGAPLYSQIALGSSDINKNSYLRDAVNYYAVGKNGLRLQHDALQAEALKLIGDLKGWLASVAGSVSALLQAAFMNAGSYQVRLANNLEKLSRLQIISLNIDMGWFQSQQPLRSFANHSQAAVLEMVQLSSVLSNFVNELTCDTVERYLRMTAQLELVSQAEYGPLSHYINVTLLSRLSNAVNVQVRDLKCPITQFGGERQATIPEQAHNKRTGKPVYAPCLTTRVAALKLNNFRFLRIDLAKTFSELAVMTISVLCTHKLLPSGPSPDSYTDLPATSLVSIGTLFNHRFQQLQARTRVPFFHSYETYKQRTAQTNSGETINPFSSFLVIARRIANDCSFMAAQYLEESPQITSQQLNTVHYLHAYKSAMDMYVEAVDKLIRVLYIEGVPEEHREDLEQLFKKGEQTSDEFVKKFDSDLSPRVDILHEKYKVTVVPMTRLVSAESCDNENKGRFASVQEHFCGGIYVPTVAEREL